MSSSHSTFSSHSVKILYPLFHCFIYSAFIRAFSAHRDYTGHVNIWHLTLCLLILTLADPSVEVHSSVAVFTLYFVEKFEFLQMFFTFDPFVFCLFVFCRNTDRAIKWWGKGHSVWIYDIINLLVTRLETFKSLSTS